MGANIQVSSACLDEAITFWIFMQNISMQSTSLKVDSEKKYELIVSERAESQNR